MLFASATATVRVGVMNSHWMVSSQIISDILYLTSLCEQAVTFIESSDYHALWRNCIHAADLLLRVMTGGALINGPILYDLLAGEVPKVRPKISIRRCLEPRAKHLEP